MQVYTLFEGSYSVDASKKFIPFDAAIHQAKDRPASLFIHVQPFLVELDNDLVLCDTGLGFSDTLGEMVLHNNIRYAGFDPEDVTKVLMSHLHYDHAGGMVKSTEKGYELSFPNAQYVINKQEWDYAYTDAASSSYHQDILDFVKANANVLFVENSGSLSDEIHYEFTGGHTPYHQVFLFESEGRKAFFGGDVLPEAHELVHNFIAKYDFDGRKTMELRKAFGHRAVEEDWMCLFYHGKNHYTGYVQMIEGMFSII